MKKTEREPKISCAYFISSWISGRKSDTEYNLEGKMAAENMGIGIFSEYICRKKYRQYWISERNIKIQRCFLSVEYNLWIFGFGAPLAVITLLGSGLYAGMIMTVSILEFGFAGGVIGMGLLLPQYLFYIPVWLYSMEQEWKISSEIWRNRGLISGEVSIYLKNVHCSSRIFSGNTYRMLCEPSDHWHYSEIYKNF